MIVVCTPIATPCCRPHAKETVMNEAGRLRASRSELGSGIPTLQRMHPAARKHDCQAGVASRSTDVDAACVRGGGRTVAASPTAARCHVAQTPDVRISRRATARARPRRARSIAPRCSSARWSWSARSSTRAGSYWRARTPPATAASEAPSQTSRGSIPLAPRSHSSAATVIPAEPPPTIKIE